MSTNRTPRRESIITGDAIELEIQPAAIPLRLMAQVVDVAVIGSLMMLVVLILIDSGPFRLNAAQTQTLGIVMIATITFVIPLLMELFTGGRSLGKMMVGLRVLRADGGPVRLRHVFVRQLVGLFENWLTFGAVASIASMFNARGQRFGDMLAGTYCVRMRDDNDHPYPLIMPPELQAWATKAEIGPLSSSLTIRARTFLNRAARLSPHARARLGVALAEELLAHVQPPPPMGTHPERFLAAVLVTRRDEEYRRYLHQVRQEVRESV
ncbi:MAG: RDD family protein [Bowdeniella nasicola]|nr:RDD family protein [Bowdeniella nasicola]